LTSENKKELSPVIIFDFGSVLMDWNPHYLFDKMMGNDPKAVDNFLAEIGFSTWNPELDRGQSFAEGTALLIAEFPQYADLIRAYDERYFETVGGCIQPTVDILRELKDRGYTLYGLSNWSAEKFSKVRIDYPFFEWFDDIVLSGEVGMIKPDREIYELLLNRVGRPAGECLFIDDHSPNIQTAKDLGFQTIQFKSAEQLEMELSKLGILPG
jgi:2-haloacid dehalogenase